MTTAKLPRTKDVTYREASVRFPEEMAFVFAPDNDMGSTIERDAMMLYPYVMQGMLSTGRVAEIIGSDRLSVIRFYESSGLPWLAYDMSDLEHDLDTMRQLGVLRDAD